MAINTSGILKSPQGSAIQNAEIIFEQTRTSTEVLAGTKFSVITNQTGNYSSSLGVGTYVFKVRFQDEIQYRTVASNVIVTQYMNNYSLNQIIQDQSQLQDVDYNLLQAVLQARDTQVQQASEASQSQDQAQASQTHSQDSQAHSQQQQGAQLVSQTQQGQSQSQQATSQSNAKSSETQAQQSQTSATTSAQQAQTSKDAQHQSTIIAGESKDQAKISQDQQKISETNQQSSQQQSQASQASASLSGQSQLQSKDAAKASEISAQSSAQAQLVSQSQQAQSQSNASLSEAAALASKNQAAVSQDQQYSSAQHSEANKEEAKAWASKPEDQVVQGGLYSARHYAAKAASYAQTQLGQLIWRGGWSAQSGQTPPTPTGSTQDFYRITQAGTILGISYDVGDYIHWDTINSIWFKMDGTDSVTSVNGDTGQVNLTQQKVGAVESHTWLAKVKLGTWSAIGRFYPHLLGGKAIVTVGMTRFNFVANARFLISWGHSQHATITQLESHGYCQIMVRVGTTVGDSCIFSILDENYGAVQQGTEVEYFCQVDSLFGQLDKYTSFTEDTSTAKSTLNTEYKAIKIGNNKVYHQGFTPTSQEVGAFPLTGGTLNGGIIAKQYAIAESNNGQNWLALEAIDTGLPYISTKIGNVALKAIEFGTNGKTRFMSNVGVNGAVISEAWGNAFSTIGGNIRSNNASVMSLDGKTFSFVTSPADAHLCQNSFWDGVNWNKYNANEVSGHLFVGQGKLRFNSSEAGNIDPNQNRYYVYHTGFKPTPTEIGAAAVTDVYSKRHIDEKNWMCVADLRNAVRPPNWFNERSITTWFNEVGNPTSGWYSGINVRGWEGVYASWELLSGADIPVTQAADQATTALWFRSGNGDTWGEFQKVYTTKHKPTPAEIGAIPTNTANGTPVAAYYTDAAQDETGTKIRLPFNVTSLKMVSFTVRVYQDYQSHDIQFSGYLYSGVNNWHAPKAIMIAGSAPVLYAMGRDDDGRAYVWIGGNNYRGVGVFDVVGGYNQADWNTGWEISVSDHKPNLAMEGAVYPPYSPANKPNAHEIGAAPDGFGVGGYGATIGTVLGDCNLRRQSGFFQGSFIEGLPISPHPYNYVFNQAHLNDAGYFGYLAISFDCSKAWIGGQTSGAQKGPFELVKRGDRITAAGATGSDYNKSSIEVIGSGGGIKPAIGFHQPSEFAGSIALWGASDFRFLIQGLSDYAGIMTGNVNANDVYIRSDIRLKKNLVKLDGALEKVSQLTAYSYDKKQTFNSAEYDKHEVGLIAQDVEKVLPEAINRIVDSTDDCGEEVLTISTPAIIALLVEAIKELKAEVDQLRRLINDT